MCVKADIAGRQGKFFVGGVQRFYVSQIYFDKTSVGCIVFFFTCLGSIYKDTIFLKLFCKQ